MQIDRSHAAEVRAVLGPTNTGKTHLALERMMAHSSGMIGFPLRLLARENYDRVVREKGAAQVALITGEEKILPAHARYFLCTVESMPVDREVDFLGVDEIQLCCDPDRGHIFTDRLLNARGRHETMFMGSQIMEPLIRELLDEVTFEDKPRFSNLVYAGAKKITRLPNRSAIVAFSASEVYAIAELIRRQKGGAAVVMGALSPRTRNAQVALYQNGEVDYIVATDAIGMGLNMDVGHVAFASLSKFDGRQMRRLSPSETAQIAGRAGRFTTDGTFGVTADCPDLESELVERLENHEFDPLETIYWRNSRLRFTNLETLWMDLRQNPKTRSLMRPRLPEDEITLEFLSKNADVQALAQSPERIRLLWDVCQVPDFSKTMSDSHPRLLGQIYTHLCSPKRVLPTDWVAGHVGRLDRLEGDIDTLTQRLAGVRIWTYIANRAKWLQNPQHWQGVTRELEDRLSDALHEQLTKRFVDRRTSTLMKKLKDRDELLVSVSVSGDVRVEGHYVGQLKGFQFSADQADSPHAKKALNSASLKALFEEINRRIAQLENDPDTAFELGADSRIYWDGVACARLKAGRDILTPALQLMPFDLVDAPGAKRIQARLEKWLGRQIEKTLKPLFKIQNLQKGPAVRGVAYHLGEGLGTVRRTEVQQMVDDLEKEDRFYLRQAGGVIGRHFIYCPKLLKAAPVALRAQLWTLYHAPQTRSPAPAAGLMSVKLSGAMDRRFYRAIGYEIYGQLALRIDLVERLAEKIWELTKKGPALMNGDLASLAGCSLDDLAEVIKTLGYVIHQKETGMHIFRKKNRKKPNGAHKTTNKPHKPVPSGPKIDANSPFAKLQGWGK